MRRAGVVGLALVMLAFAAACTWGTISDEQTGAAVRGATVTITDSQGQVVTVAANDAGLYIVGQRLAEGSATFQVSAPGYETTTEQHVIAYDDNNGQEIKHFKLRGDGTAPAPTSFTLRFAPAPVPAAVGVPSSLSVEAAQVESLKAFSFVVEYDDSVVDVTGVASLNAVFNLCPGLLPDTGGGAMAGAFEATCGSTAESGLPGGTVALARVDFVCRKAGSSPLTIARAEAANTLSQTLTPALEHSSINCG